MLSQIVAASLSTDSVLDVEKAEKLCGDAKLDEGDGKACIAVLSTILKSSARFNVFADVLGSELEQLGLPKEHATAVCRVYNEHSSKIREKLSKNILQLTNLEELELKKIGNSGHLKLRIHDNSNDKSESHHVNLTSEQLALLLNDMKTARDVMMDSTRISRSSDVSS